MPLNLFKFLVFIKDVHDKGQIFDTLPGWTQYFWDIGEFLDEKTATFIDTK